MGNPAARLGDPGGHGGAVVMGCPTVMIGGMPAARVGDMHVCPMLTGMVPHVGGPVMLGAFTVLVGAMPQARLSDMAMCVGPPDMIAMGAPTVLVDMGGGGGGGAMGAAAGAKASTGKSPMGETPPAHRLPDGTWEVRMDHVVVRGEPWFQAQVIRDLGAIRATRDGAALLHALRATGRTVTIVDGGPAGNFVARRAEPDADPAAPADSVVGHRPDRTATQPTPGSPARHESPRPAHVALQSSLARSHAHASGGATHR